MSKQSKLIKNTLILFLGKISTQFISFFLLPLFTTLLTTAEYGTFDLITTYIVLLVPIITFQLELSTFRYLIDFRNDDEKKKLVISNCYGVVLLVLIIILILFPIIGIIFKIQYWPYLLFMVCATICSNMLLQTCRGLGDNIGYSITCVVIGVTNVIITILLLVIFHLGVYSLFIASIISNFIGAMFIFMKDKIYKYISKKALDKNFQKEALRYSLPLVPNGLMWWIIDASDRTIIAFIIGVSANGVYSISNKFSNIINSLYSIFNMSWTESVSMYINDNDDFLETSFNNIFNLVCSFCLCLINGMFIVFPLLVNSKFKEAYYYIPILILSSVFNMLSSNLSAIYIANKKTKKIMYTTIGASLINIIINLIFINKIGLYAAAISTLISFAILFILRYKDVKKFVNIHLNKNKLGTFILLFIISFIVYEINNFYLSIITLILTIIIVSYINKKIIQNYIKKLFKINVNIKNL